MRVNLSAPDKQTFYFDGLLDFINISLESGPLKYTKNTMVCMLLQVAKAWELLVRSVLE